MTLNYILKNVSSNRDDGEKFSKGKNKFQKSILSFMMFLFTMTSMIAQTTYTSVQSGNYSDPATWGTETAPTSEDNIVVVAGMTVTLDNSATVNDANISGTIKATSTSPDFIVTHNLTVNSGGLLDGIWYFDGGGWGYNKGIQISVAGNITNNGRINLSEGAGHLPEGVLKLNGTTVQTVSGLGTFGGTVAKDDYTNTLSVINQLIVDNTNPATPNVIWGFNNIKIKSTFSLLNARIDLGENKMTIGNYSSATTNCDQNSGFTSGTVGRWYSNDTFNPIIPGVDYFDSKTIFPFISATGKSRAAFISRPKDNSYPEVVVAGELTVTYYDAPGMASGLSYPDGSYTVTDVYEGVWTVAKDATYANPIGDHTIAFSAQDAYLIKNGDSRIITAEGTTVGTHQTGTVTPFAARTGLTDADLNNTFLVGYNAALDTPVTSLQSGNWNDASTWSNNSVPSCGEIVTLLSGHTITINTTSAVAGVNINEGATLISESGTLTVGCTNNNASFTNSGTYTISGGGLIVNGNVSHNPGSTFNQTGGDITVDGNNNGDVATSTEKSIFKIATSSVNLTAGKITIVDPPVTNASYVTTHNATAIVKCTGFFCWYPTVITVNSDADLKVGQIVVGEGVPLGTVIAAINGDGTINTSPSLPETGLTLPLTLSFYKLNSITSPLAFEYNSNNNYAAGENHTLQIGDGISTEKSTVTTNGFNFNLRASEGTLSLNNLTVDAADPANRFVNLQNNDNSNVVLNVQNDFTILQGKVKGSAVNTYFGGNVINNGALNVNNTTYFANFINGVAVATAKPQTVSGTGTFNAQPDVSLNTPANTGSVSQLQVNNTSPEGLTFLVPFNVVSSLTMTAGIIHTSATSLLTIGTPTMSYTGNIFGNFGETCYIDGPVSKDIMRGSKAMDITNGSIYLEKFFFPVGKSSYTPIWVGVTTLESEGFQNPGQGTNLKVEAFDTNNGTNSANISNLSQNRWEVSKTAGIVLDFNIRVADPNGGATSIIVQSDAAAGVYDNDFGITATFVEGTEGTPSTLTPNMDPQPFESFKGFFSTARQSECIAVEPGNTVASEANICGGKSVTLSLENVVVGEGITYQWQTSTTDSDYTDIEGANAKTFSASPVEDTYYRCNVTCTFSTTTVASTPVQLTLNNTIIATTPETICMPIDTATLTATSSSGEVKWYDMQVGGTTLGTGNSFTTPSITETTTYYAGTETTSEGTAGLSITEEDYASGSGNNGKGLAFNLYNSIILNSVNVYPQQSPEGAGVMPMTIMVLQNGVQVPGTLPVVFTPNTAPGYSPSTTPQTVNLGFSLAAGNNYTLEITDGAAYGNELATTTPDPNPYPITSGAVSITGALAYGTVEEYGYNYFYDWDVTEVCSSARVAVIAKVKTAEECNLSTVSMTESLAKVMVYPNPYTQTFKLDIQSYSSNKVDIKVYDMFGRLIENKTTEFNKLSNVEIGNGYPTGIYNVVVNQDGKTKSLKVIKK